MTSAQLREEIDIEIDCLCTLVQEINSLQNDVEGREATVRERTAAAAFLAQFYGGIENILKRIHRYYGLALPTGDTWQLFQIEWERIIAGIKSVEGVFAAFRLSVNRFVGDLK